MGTLTIQDGGTVTSSGASVGLSARSIGTVTVTGPGSNWSNGPSGGLNIGSFGTGTLTIANGGRVINITAANTANIGSGIGSNGAVTVTGAGSTWSNSSGVNIGNRGTGTLTIADGGVVTGPSCDCDECRCDRHTEHRRGRGRSCGCPRHAYFAEPRIWRRHRHAQLQSYVSQLRVCARDHRQRDCQCVRRHYAR